MKNGKTVFSPMQMYYIWSDHRHHNNVYLRSMHSIQAYWFCSSMHKTCHLFIAEQECLNSKEKKAMAIWIFFSFLFASDALPSTNTKGIFEEFLIWANSVTIEMMANLLYIIYAKENKKKMFNRFFVHFFSAVIKILLYIRSLMSTEASTAST